MTSDHHFTIRFAAPMSPEGRHSLLCGSATMGAVYPPAGTECGETEWVWQLFDFGENPRRLGRAKDEATAKGHLVASLALTLVDAGLAPQAQNRGQCLGGIETLNIRVVALVNASIAVRDLLAPFAKTGRMLPRAEKCFEELTKAIAEIKRYADD